MCFGGSQNAAAKINANRQYDMDLAKWQYNRQKMLDNFEYRQDQFDTQVWNEAQNRAYKDETSKNDWIYREEMRRFDYNNQVSAYNASLESYEKQLDYNNLAAEITSNDNTRKYNERLTAIGFQQEEAFNKFGFDTREMSFQRKATRTEKGLKGQQMLISALKEQGGIRATGQTGRSARKNFNASLAAYAQKNAALTQSVLQDEESYEFGLERAHSSYNLGKRQLQESMKSAKAQHESDIQNVALQKYSADMAAESKIAPEPQLPPALPKPLELPAPRHVAPQPVPSWEQYGKLKPKKGAVASQNVLGQVANLALSIGTSYLGAKMGS